MKDGFFNDDLMEALDTGMYICSKCGAFMNFEDEEFKDVLICPECGHEVEFDRYGIEDDDEFDALYPTKEEVCGYDDEDDSDDAGETYEEVCNELDD